MLVSKIVAGALSLVFVAGGGYALSSGGKSATPREAICNDKHLNFPDQESCRVQMKAADTEVAKQQIATRFQSKVDRSQAALAPAPEFNANAPQPETLRTTN